MEGVKDSQGRPFGSCEWERAGQLWRSASEAVVQRSSQELAVRVLLKKALVGRERTLTDTAFFQFELVGLARHPPKGGLKILNAHESTKCGHVMPLLRARIEEVGSEKDWKSVQSFSCVDVPELPQRGEAKDLDSQAFQFPKPWSDLDPECKVTNKAWESLRGIQRVSYFLFCFLPGEVLLVFLSLVRSFPKKYLNPQLTTLNPRALDPQNIVESFREPFKGPLRLLSGSKQGSL